MIEYLRPLAILPVFIALVIRGSERRLIRRFRGQRAQTPESAISLGSVNRLVAWQVRRLTTAGALVESGTSMLWLSEEGYASFRSGRRRRALWIAIPLLVLAVALVVWSHWTYP